VPNQLLDCPTPSTNGYTSTEVPHAFAIDPLLESFDVTRPTPPVDHLFDISKCLAAQPDNHSSQYLGSSYNMTLYGHDAPNAGSFMPASSTNNDYGQNIQAHPSNISDEFPETLLPCACLANHYLIISKIQASSSSPSTSSRDIAERIRLYRSALETASTILNCESCLKSQITGVHNVFQVISLLNTLIWAYKKLSDDVNSEVDAAEREKRTKSFRFVELDPNTTNSNISEPAGVDIALSPTEWQRLILSAIRKDIYNSSVQQDPLYSQQAHHTLESITAAMEARQKHIHATREPVLECAHNEFSCLKLLDQIKQGISGLNLSRE